MILPRLQLIVSVLTLVGVLTIPDIIREGSDFVQRLKAENVWVVVLEKLRHGVGCALYCAQGPFLPFSIGFPIRFPID